MNIKDLEFFAKYQDNDDDDIIDTVTIYVYDKKGNLIFEGESDMPDDGNIDGIILLAMECVQLIPQI